MNRTQEFRTGECVTAAIRSVYPADLPALRDFFEGLSLQTRYLRFFGPVTPTAALLDLLCGRADNVHAVVAVAGGVIVGHAMAVDLAEPGDPGDPANPRDPGQTWTADIGVMVTDAWQGQGIGSALMRAVVARAEIRGVTSLAMDVLHGNRRVLNMIIRRWPQASIDQSRDSLGIRVQLPRYQPPPPPPVPLPAGPAARPARPLVALGR